MYARFLFGNREISSLTVDACTGRRLALRRRGAEVNDARVGEVRPCHSSDETCEQSRANGGGVGGAKGRDQRVLRVAIEWGRHGDTCDYNYNTGQIQLPEPAEAPASQV
jgi:hypothetical protein